MIDIEKLKKRCGYDGKPLQFKFGFVLACRELTKAQAVPEWISVEDGLPSDGQDIIAFDAIKHCVFKDGEFLQRYFEPDTGHGYTEPVDVTHWIAIEAQELNQ